MNGKSKIATACIIGSATLIIALNMNNTFASTGVYASQVGYQPNDKKAAMITGGTKEKKFTVYTTDGDKKVYTGTLTEAKEWEESGEAVQWAEFDGLNKENEYYIKVGNTKSEPFVVKESGLWDDMNLWAHKSFYLWRCSQRILPEFAGFDGDNYARAGGHPDTKVIVHETAESATRKAGDTVSSRGGWYDAGDYGKYTINAAVTLQTLLDGYELFKEYYNGFQMGIPETMKPGADLLHECLYELRWLSTMQDAEDGAVAHKLTTKRFAGMVMPAECSEQRFLIGKSTMGNLSFAAIMAKAARIYGGEQWAKGETNGYIEQAEKAWQWAKENPEVMFKNPDGVNTGEYGNKEENMWRYRFWAATELYLATGKEEYKKDIVLESDTFTFPTWQTPDTYALISLTIAAHQGRIEGDIAAKAKSRYKAMADRLMEVIKNNPGRMPFKRYRWGSNCELANTAMVLAVGYAVFGVKEYMDAVRGALAYITGSNPTGYCFVTGFGSNSPIYIHDRRSTADGIKKPLPGLMVGGPNTECTSDLSVYPHKLDHKARTYPTTKYPARCYVDEISSFSTNEVAINWNSPLCFVLTAVINLK